jgi:hypothetical protein
MNKKKMILIVAAAAVLLGAGGVFAYIRSNDKTALFYSAVANDTLKDRPNREIGQAEGTLASADAVITKDDIFKGSGAFSCKAETNVGGLSLDMSIVMYQEELFSRIDTLQLDDGTNSEEIRMTNELYQLMSGTWILMPDDNPAGKAFKEKGVFYGNLGAVSKRHSGEDIAGMLKKHKVFTLRESNNVTENGKPAIEYRVKIGKDAYGKFIDELTPGLSNKDDILDGLFDDMDEITVVVDKESKKVIKSSYEIKNICADFMNGFDPNAAKDMPKTMRVEATTPKNSGIRDLVRPTDFVLQKDFNKLFAQ